MPLATETTAPWRLGLSTAQLANALGIDSSPSPRVQIDWSQVQRIAAHIAHRSEFTQFEREAWDDDHFWNVADSKARRSQFFAIGNAVNFRFWRHEGEQRVTETGTLGGRTYSGALYMWRALRRALDKQPDALLEARFVASLSEKEFDSIFRDDNGINPLAVAKEERIANLRDLGERLLAEWDGQFWNAVCATDHSLVEFVRVSKAFRAFDDPVLKLTMLNAILHSGSGIYAFRDEPLPAIDYHLLKQAMRQGVLRPGPSLSKKLRTSQLLDASEAQELRRVALIAFVGLAQETGLSGEVLDNMYWRNRVNCTDDQPVCLDAATAAACPFYGACVQTVDFRLPLELTRYY